MKTLINHSVKQAGKELLVTVMHKWRMAQEPAADNTTKDGRAKPVGEAFYNYAKQERTIFAKYGFLKCQRANLSLNYRKMSGGV
jgi:hypothetical protein